MRNPFQNHQAMVRYLLFIIILLIGYTRLVGQTSLGGMVTSKQGEPIILGNIAVYKNGNLITGAETSFEGKYLIGHLSPGTYDVEFSAIGYPKVIVEDAIVFADTLNKLDVVLQVDAMPEKVLVQGYKYPNKTKDVNTEKGLIRALIKSFASRKVDSLLQRMKLISFERTNQP